MEGNAEHSSVSRYMKSSNYEEVNERKSLEEEEEEESLFLLNVEYYRRGVSETLHLHDLREENTTSFHPTFEDLKLKNGDDQRLHLFKFFSLCPTSLHYPPAQISSICFS